MSSGYDTLFRTLGKTLEDFLGNLDYLHSAYMKTMYPEMIVPSFRVEKLTDGDILLHYYSNRRGICGYVSGNVCCRYISSKAVMEISNLINH